MAPESVAELPPQPGGNGLQPVRQDDDHLLHRLHHGPHPEGERRLLWASGRGGEAGGLFGGGREVVLFFSGVVRPRGQSPVQVPVPREMVTNRRMERQENSAIRGGRGNQGEFLGEEVAPGAHDPSPRILKGPRTVARSPGEADVGSAEERAFRKRSDRTVKAAHAQ